MDRSEESGARLIKVLLNTHSKKWPTPTNCLPFQNVHLKLLWMIMFANCTWFEQKNRLRLFHIWDLRNLMQIHLQNRRKSSTKIGSRQSDNPNLFRGQCSLMTLGTSMLFNHFPQTGHSRRFRKTENVNLKTGNCWNAKSCISNHGSTLRSRRLLPPGLSPSCAISNFSSG